MNLPNIYKYLDTKYNPLIGYLFILPASEFIDFLESINSVIGGARENHGYEITCNSIKFWNINEGEEMYVNISNKEFVALIEPLKQDFIKEFSNYEKEVNLIILKILRKNTFLEYNTTKLEKLFLKELERFYRNYGSEWKIDDFSNKIKNNKEKLEKILTYLSEKEIVSINDKDNFSFKILKLPNHF